MSDHPNQPVKQPQSATEDSKGTDSHTEPGHAAPGEVSPGQAASGGSGSGQISAGYTVQPAESLINSRVVGHSGIIELDRPKALNSLTHAMVRDLRETLDTWESDDSIKVVVLRSSSPRAFCAGGDVRGVRESDLAGDLTAGDRFFAEEYELNLAMARYSKPIVSLLEGVVMGGGFGISAHGSHRVVTPRTIGAMPEAAIGFVPDVGMSYVLTHMAVDPAVGLFIGCTGWRLTPADMLFTGLGNVLVDDVTELADRLSTEHLWEALGQASLQSSVLEEPTSELEAHLGWIVNTFGEGSWLDIERRIAASDSAEGAEAVFVSKVKELLSVANPASLVACVELFRRSAEVDVEVALRNELAVANALRREPNFAEGVRAVLVDKDRSPRFRPSSADQVDPQRYRALLS